MSRTHQVSVFTKFLSVFSSRNLREISYQEAAEVLIILFSCLRFTFVHLATGQGYFPDFQHFQIDTKMPGIIPGFCRVLDQEMVAWYYPVAQLDNFLMFKVGLTGGAAVTLCRYHLVLMS